MSEQTPEDKQNENRWLGILAAFGVVWYLILAAQYGLSLMSSIEDLKATGATDDQIAYIYATPFWAHSAKSLAVLAGVFGSVALFLRKSAAYWLLAVAVIGTMGVMLDAVLRGGFKMFGGATSSFSVMAIIIALFLFWFAHNAKLEKLI